MSHRCLASESSARHLGVAQRPPPGPEQRRDLIEELAANATPHSIVRYLLLVGWKVSATLRKELCERDDDRATQRPDTKIEEVILGVDTHLDFHTAVAVDHLWADAWAG